MDTTTKTGTELALPPAVKQAVIPPPTKTELIEAMARRRIALQIEARDKHSAAREKAHQAARESILEHFREVLHQTCDDSILDVDFGWNNGNGRSNNINVKVKFDNAPAKAHQLIVEWRNLSGDRVNVETLTEAVKVIRSQMQRMAPNRVGAMLSDPSVVRGLDRMIKQLATTPEPSTQLPA